jgi:hypothetical protein
MRTLVHKSSKLPVRPARELQNKFIRHRLHTARSRRAAIFTLSKTHGAKSAVAPRPAPGPDAAAPRTRPPARRCADPPAHVAMTMQSLLSPAADVPPDWLWAAMGPEADISGADCAKHMDCSHGSPEQRPLASDSAAKLSAQYPCVMMVSAHYADELSTQPDFGSDPGNFCFVFSAKLDIR